MPSIADRKRSPSWSAQSKAPSAIKSPLSKARRAVQGKDPRSGESARLRSSKSLEAYRQDDLAIGASSAAQSICYPGLQRPTRRRSAIPSACASSPACREQQSLWRSPVLQRRAPGYLTQLLSKIRPKPLWGCAPQWRVSVLSAVMKDDRLVAFKRPADPLVRLP